MNFEDFNEKVLPFLEAERIRLWTLVMVTPNVPRVDGRVRGLPRVRGQSELASAISNLLLDFGVSYKNSQATARIMREVRRWTG